MLKASYDFRVIGMISCECPQNGKTELFNQTTQSIKLLLSPFRGTIHGHRSGPQGSKGHSQEGRIEG